jgi:hypothetical protein
MTPDGTALEALFRLADDPPGEAALPLPPLSALPSGRLLKLIEGGRGDLLEIRSPDGRVELSVRLTEDGPVLVFESAKLDVRSMGDVQVACETFSVRASEGIEMRTQGEVRVRGAGDVHVDGDNVLLNCGPR